MESITAKRFEGWLSHSLEWVMVRLSVRVRQVSYYYGHLWSACEMRPLGSRVPEKKKEKKSKEKENKVPANSRKKTITHV